ncbi:MAG: succinate:quinone oxidoreductase [Planctomycetota bacterium]|nr:MAG: succinate:quinone oxidoreductase [Planctomycetota bacterium]
MNRLAAATRSSLGRKMIVAVTGLMLLGFVIAHMLGNLQLFLGPEALNAYAAKLQSLGPGLWAMRLGLLGIFVLHVATALKLAAESQAARPQAYVGAVGKVQATVSSRTMVLSGATVLAFVAYHLAHFTLGVVHPEHADVGLDAAGQHDVFAMVVAGFSSPLVSGLYLLAMALLALHLHHGISSTVRTLGLENPACTACVRRAGMGLALFIFLGNASMPLAVLAGLVGAPAGA